MGKKEEYLDLLTKSYAEAVETLFNKYGASDDDYFKEKSYERFLNGEIKSIGKGKYSKSAEGLECHHIDEDKYQNLSNIDFIKAYRYPFKYQKKERLVFCDIVEHTILHTLIAKETSLHFGYPGYEFYLRPRIKDWYIDENIPKKIPYQVASYRKAYLKPNEAIELLEKMDSMIVTA